MADENPIDEAVHKRLAVDCFNGVWGLLTKADRTSDEDERMVNMAHASHYHWSFVGTPLNAARGDWQISRVYAVLGRAEPALHHARRCLALCEEHGYKDFDLAYAYEAMARAHAAGGDAGECARFRELAERAGADIAEAEDRDLFVSDLKAEPWFGL